jgi:hypothetical protein
MKQLIWFVLLLSGCASFDQTRYGGISGRDRNQDSAQCEAQAETSYWKGAQQTRIYDACMRGKGYGYTR